MSRTEPNPLDELLLHAYLDGELHAAEEAEVVRRLESDPTLAARLEELRELFETLARVEDLQLSRDLTPSVMSSLAVRTPNRRALTVLLAAQLAVATLLAGLIWPLFGSIGRVITTPAWNLSILSQQFEAALTSIGLAWSGRWIALQSLVADAAARFAGAPPELAEAASAWPYVFSAALGLLLIDGLILRYWQGRRKAPNGN